MIQPPQIPTYSTPDDTPSLASVRRLLDNFLSELFPDAKYAAFVCRWEQDTPPFQLPHVLNRACDNATRSPGRPLSEVLRVLRAFVLGNFPDAEYAYLLVCINPKKDQSELFKVYSKEEPQSVKGGSNAE